MFDLGAGGCYRPLVMNPNRPLALGAENSEPDCTPAAIVNCSSAAKRFGGLAKLSAKDAAAGCSC